MSVSEKKVSGECTKKELIKLRPAGLDDADFLWKLANDPDVRSLSFSSNPIPWDDHIKWFKSKLNSQSCIFFIAYICGKIPIGQVRYDITNDKAVISISLQKDFRGKGYGSTMIKLSSNSLFSESNVTKIHAYIKPSNISSVSAFLKDNFTNLGVITYKKQQVFDLLLVKNVN